MDFLFGLILGLTLSAAAIILYQLADIHATEQRIREIEARQPTDPE